MSKRLIACLALLVLIAGALPLSAKAARAVPREIYPLSEAEIPDTPDGQHHYLLLCMDSWENTTSVLGNTDGIILATLDTRQRRIIFNTFTREMLIQRPDGGIGRITYIGKNYGLPALCGIISSHFGVKVDKYALFSMTGIQDIIDAMGGVYITVTDEEAAYLNRYRIKRDSTTPSMDKAGTYLFGGHAAVIYMRIRKVGGGGDAGRTRRIRTVLNTLTDKYKESTLDEALSLLEKVSACLLETNLSMQDMLEAVSYAMELRGVTPEGYQMPPDEALEDIYYAGMATRQVDFDYCRKLLQQLFDPMPTAAETPAPEQTEAPADDLAAAGSESAPQ